MADYAQNRPGKNIHYRLGAGYSQWRKVFLGFELVRASGVQYSLIVRARPDITVLKRFDLRQIEQHYGSLPSTKNARGNFIAVPERTMQVITDHFALGTPDVMFGYAAEALPFTETCCEGYVWQNLEDRCMARTTAVISEELYDLKSLKEKMRAADIRPDNRDNWLVIPKVHRNSADWSPLILTNGAAYELGHKVCRGSDARCVPIYRIGLMYVFKASVYPWFSKNALCLRYENEGATTAKFLISAGIATARPDVDTMPIGDAPCVAVKGLEAAHASTMSSLAALNKSVSKGLIKRARQLRELEDSKGHQLRRRRQRRS